MFLVNWTRQHPYLVAWAVLAVGMVALLIWQASGVIEQPGQWAALIGITIAVAGVCVWIVRWE